MKKKKRASFGLRAICLTTLKLFDESPGHSRTLCIKHNMALRKKKNKKKTVTYPPFILSAPNFFFFTFSNLLKLLRRSWCLKLGRSPSWCLCCCSWNLPACSPWPWDAPQSYWGPKPKPIRHHRPEGPPGNRLSPLGSSLPVWTSAWPETPGRSENEATQQTHVVTHWWRPV